MKKARERGLMGGGTGRKGRVDLTHNGRYPQGLLMDGRGTENSRRGDTRTKKWEYKREIYRGCLGAVIVAHSGALIVFQCEVCRQQWKPTHPQGGSGRTVVRRRRERCASMTNDLPHPQHVVR